MLLRPEYIHDLLRDNLRIENHINHKWHCFVWVNFDLDMMDRNCSCINIHRVEDLYSYRMYMNHYVLYWFQLFHNDNFLFHIFVDKLEFLLLVPMYMLHEDLMKNSIEWWKNRFNIELTDRIESNIIRARYQYWKITSRVWKFRYHEQYVCYTRL